MEQQSSTPLGLLLGLPLVAIGLAVIFAYLVGGNERPERSAETAPSEYAAAPEPTPYPPESPPQTAPAVPPAPGVAPAAPPATGAPPPARRPEPDAAVQAEELKDPKIQQHAQLISVETARLAMQQRDVERLKRLRETLSDPRMAQIIPAGDLEAMDVGIACLTRASGFRQRADDFLDDNPSSPLSDSVRGACN